jgi:hypothetical protein
MTDTNQHPNVRYEPTDASFRWVLGILAGSLILAACVFFLVNSFFFRYRDYQDTIGQSHFPLAPVGSPTLPSEPRLEQVNRMSSIETGDISRRLESKEDALNNYGSTKEQGYVHIPIDRAIDRLANKLPVRAKQPTAEQERRQNGLVDAGESNSGRMFRGSRHE